MIKKLLMWNRYFAWQPICFCFSFVFFIKYVLYHWKMTETKKKMKQFHIAKLTLWSALFYERSHVCAWKLKINLILFDGFRLYCCWINEKKDEKKSTENDDIFKIYFDCLISNIWFIFSNKTNCWFYFSNISLLWLAPNTLSDLLFTHRIDVIMIPGYFCFLVSKKRKLLWSVGHQYQRFNEEERK